ncbi:acyltransferase [Gemmata sp. G18]|uniref:Acyltransferase n=1 Tax=Gemmata palustris TaxID=2822762 RepID=A0ABS5C3B6_9BACT|nr:acyltransferase [Gemmata palustris]
MYTTPALPLSSGRVPGLDGLRAISISLVYASHLAKTKGLNLPRPDLISRHGAIGVDVFFVISGFLITLLLFRESGRTGQISLWGFWRRRVLRIIPAYLSYLLVVALLSYLGVYALTGSDWVASLTYTVNFLPRLDERWPIGHLWSLSVEEHFYLLWPFALVLFGRRAAGFLLVVVVASSPAIRYVLWLTLRDRLDIDFATPARMDTLAVGCLLAYLLTGRAGPTVLAWAGRRATGLFLVGVCGIILSLVASSLSGKVAITIARPLVAGFVALVTLAAVANAHSRVTRLLEFRPLVWIGTLSYSLYLWQGPFLNPHSDAWVARWPVNLALSVAAATACHYLIERPFLRLKARNRGGSEIEGEGRSNPPLRVPQ